MSKTGSPPDQAVVSEPCRASPEPSYVTPPGDRYVLTTRVPYNVKGPIFLWGLAIVGIVISGIVNPYNVAFRASDLVKFFAVIFLLLLPLASAQVWLAKSYRISYDDQAVYMRGAEWRWRMPRFVRVERAMRFDEIAELGAGQAENVEPFAYIAFCREGGEFEERFFISRLQLDDEEFRAFTQFLYTKVPGKFPPELIDYINPSYIG